MKGIFDAMKYYNIADSEPIFCPAHGWDCPFYEDGICYKRDPMEECSVWDFYWKPREEWKDF